LGTNYPLLKSTGCICKTQTNSKETWTPSAQTQLVPLESTSHPLPHLQYLYGNISVHACHLNLLFH